MPSSIKYNGNIWVHAELCPTCEFDNSYRGYGTIQIPYEWNNEWKYYTEYNDYG